MVFLLPRILFLCPTSKETNRTTLQKLCESEKHSFVWNQTIKYYHKSDRHKMTTQIVKRKRKATTTQGLNKTRKIRESTGTEFHIRSRNKERSCNPENDKRKRKNNSETEVLSFLRRRKVDTRKQVFGKTNDLRKTEKCWKTYHVRQISLEKQPEKETDNDYVSIQLIRPIHQIHVLDDFMPTTSNFLNIRLQTLMVLYIKQPITKKQTPPVKQPVYSHEQNRQKNVKTSTRTKWNLLQRI